MADCSGCVQDARVRELTQRMDKIEVKVDSTKDDIKAIKEFQTKVLWTALCGLASSVCTLILILLQKG